MIQVGDGGLVPETELSIMKHQWETRVARAKDIATRNKVDEALRLSMDDLENIPLTPDGFEQLLVERVEAIYGKG
jgi:Na+-transporting NADH:ubiquinone oxidoreductase subunit NqrF